MHKLLADLHLDHVHLARVLDILEEQLELLKTAKKPDLYLMVDILDYVQHYPDLVHHPKEEKIYEVFINRRIEDAKVVVELTREHHYLPGLSKDLHQVLESAANSTRLVSRDELKSKLEHFLNIERRHIDLEEKMLFPLINKHMQEEDWNRVELSAFKHKKDPLFGDTVEDCYQNLYQSIKQQVVVS